MSTSGDMIADVRGLLASWRAPSPEQELLRAEFLKHANSSDDAAFRECAPNHITASALIFSPDRTQVALLFHPKFDRWLQMGGHCEPGDRSVSAAALREAREESGLPELLLDPDPLLLSKHAVKCWPGGQHLDVQFLALATSDAPLVCSPESREVRWFDLAEVAIVSDESVVSLLAAASLRLAENH